MGRFLQINSNSIYKTNEYLPNKTLHKHHYQNVFLKRRYRLQERRPIDLIFHTNTESGKTNDIDSDSHINISFLNSSGEWASVSGKASIVTDRDTVKKYYSPALKAWLGDLG